MIETINKTNKNKENNTMPTKKVVKTKAELQEELEAANKQVADLKKEIKDLEKYKAYEEMADEMYAVKESFVKAGFSNDEAFQLIICFIGNAAKTVNGYGSTVERLLRGK